MYIYYIYKLGHGVKFVFFSKSRPGQCDSYYFRPLPDFSTSLIYFNFRTCHANKCNLVLIFPASLFFVLTWEQKASDPSRGVRNFGDCKAQEIKF